MVNQCSFLGSTSVCQHFSLPMSCSPAPPPPPPPTHEDMAPHGRSWNRMHQPMQTLGLQQVVEGDEFVTVLQQQP